VLSDLHLGPDGPLATFHEPQRLKGLINRWHDHQPEMELVLAGDTFDFLQIIGYDGFSATKAVERFGEIVKNPATAEVLAALNRLCKRGGVELTVLAGNHDPELLVDDVRDAFAREVGRTPGTIVWADDQPLVARKGNRLPVWGRALTAHGADGDPANCVWVVHGDRWDPSNVIDRDALRGAVAAGKGDGFELPVGSHLVFEVLSELKRDHRWVDELKPELPAVLPLLLAVAPLETMKYVGKHWRIGASLFVDTLEARLKYGPAMGETPAAKDYEEDPWAIDPLESVQRATFEELRGDPDAKRLLNALLNHLEDGVSPKREDVLAGPTGVPGLLARSWLRLVRACDRFGRLDAGDSIISPSSRYLPETLGALIAGHTHGARIRADLRPPYFNSGTWMPVRTVPSGDLQAWLDMVTEQGASRPPSPGTFVRIELLDGPPLVAVEQWPPGTSP